MTSTKGLCGSFNSEIKKFINQKVTFPESSLVNFIFLGSKCRAVLEKSKLLNVNYEILEEFSDLNKNNCQEIALKITQRVLNDKNFANEVIFISNGFENIFTQKPVLKKIFPIEGLNLSEENEVEEKEDFNDYSLEQGPEKLLKTIAKKYVFISILKLITESLTAEVSSRFKSMDNASISAEKGLETLKVQHNKIRQTAITKEISEISSAIQEDETE